MPIRVPSKPNFGALVYDPIVNEERLATKVFQDYLTTLDRFIPSLRAYVVSDFGAAGDGVRNDTGAIQTTINEAIAAGGGAVILPPGEYSIETVTLPAGSTPVTLLGYGAATILKRRSNLASGQGLLDVFGQNVTLDNFVIDGDVTVPVGLLYNADFGGIGANDPMADSLSRNTSVWVHPGANQFSFDRMRISHTGGYAVLLDGNGPGGLSDIRIANSELSNNRPNLFGATAGQAIYGSWTGGIYYNGDGRAANPGRVVKRVLMSGCRFLRNTGNNFWGHLYGLDDLHQDIQVFSNYFEDAGLDGVLIGGVIGGSVSDNVFHRIGYTTLTDTDRPVPRWLVNLNATGIDSSGVVIGVPYTGNSFTSVNGGCIDADGHGESLFADNVCRVPAPGDPDYDEDDIAICGPSNNGQAGYGVNVGNTSQTSQGGSDLNIHGNTFINLCAGAIRLFAARRCLVAGNNIIAPANSLYPPIGMGPLGAGVNQRCLNNKVTANNIDYSPASAAPAIFEDGTIAAFLPTEANTVCNNVPITGNGLATEFLKDPNSGSPTYLETVWFV